jgi:HEPN domain-containing protein
MVKKSKKSTKRRRKIKKNSINTKNVSIQNFKKDINTIEDDIFASMDEDDLSIGFPVIGDKLFEESISNNYAILSESDFFTPSLMIEGYYESAISAIERLLEQDSFGVKNSEIYPALFSFRQYLELSLKDSIHHFKYADDSLLTGKGEYDGTHNLSDLWDELSKSHPDDLDDDDDFIATKNLIEELENIDNNSMGFRYYYSKRNKKTGEKKALIKDSKIINLQNLYDNMRKLHNCLESISAYAYALVDSHDDC